MADTGAMEAAAQEAVALQRAGQPDEAARAVLAQLHRLFGPADLDHEGLIRVFTEQIPGKFKEKRQDELQGLCARARSGRLLAPVWPSGLVYTGMTGQLVPENCGAGDEKTGAAMSKEQMKAELGRLIQCLDANQNGLLDQQEFKMIMEMDGCKDLSDAWIGQVYTCVLEDCDSNGAVTATMGDGKVQMEEYVHSCIEMLHGPTASPEEATEKFGRMMADMQAKLQKAGFDLPGAQPHEPAPSAREFGVRIKQITLAGGAIDASSTVDVRPADSEATDRIDSSTTGIHLAGPVYLELLEAISKCLPEEMQPLKDYIAIRRCTSWSSRTRGGWAPLDLSQWPTLTLVLEGIEGDVELTVPPEVYWPEETFIIYPSISESSTLGSPVALFSGALELWMQSNGS